MKTRLEIDSWRPHKLSPFYSCVASAREISTPRERSFFRARLYFAGITKTNPRLELFPQFTSFSESLLSLPPFASLYSHLFYFFFGKQTESTLKFQFHLERLLVRYFLFKIAVKFNFRGLLRFFFQIVFFFAK